MTRLIGARCKASNRLSRGVLIARILLGNLETKHESTQMKANAANKILFVSFDLIRNIRDSILLNEINNTNLRE